MSVSRAVESVLSQQFSASDFEVIVVNDSGKPLSQAGWQQAERVKIIHTNHRERSVARNTGASIAKGRYLHFLDDDDWLAPDAFQHFWRLSQASQAQWLYGISQLVERDHTPTIRLQHGLNGNCFVQFMAGEWIPLQSSFIESHTFFQLGGFNPLISGPEDIDLLRRIALVGEVAETPHVIAYVVRGEEGSTTDYRAHQQASRWAREQILDAPRVFDAMHASARTPDWQGRIARIYLTSMVWNARRIKPLTASSRAIFGLASILRAGLGILSKDYWQAMAKPYASRTFSRGIREAGARY